MKRNDNESYEAYRNRRTRENEKLKMYSRGRMFWNSQYKGTYVRPKSRVVESHD